MWGSPQEADQWIKQWREERAREEAWRQEEGRRQWERRQAAERAARARELQRQKEEEFELANGPIADDFTLSPKESAMWVAANEGRCQQQLLEQACRYMDRLERRCPWASFSQMDFIPHVAFPLAVLWANRRAARRLR
jgi:hypothetical protein